MDAFLSQFNPTYSSNKPLPLNSVYILSCYLSLGLQVTFFQELSQRKVYGFIISLNRAVCRNQTKLPEFVTLTGTYDLDKSRRLSFSISIIHLPTSKLLL
jgi:hypothetical protein